MKRRRAGEGSFLFDKKTKYYRYSQWYTDPLTGIHKRKEIRSKSRAVLDQKVISWKQMIADGISSANGNMTLKAYAEEYLDTCRLTVKQSTFYNYEMALRTHILPVLGDLKIKSLTPRIIQRWVNGLSEKGLAPASVVQVRRVLCTLLNKALKFRLIPYNPASVTTIPRVPYKMPPVLNREQINTMLTLARSGSFLPPSQNVEDGYYRRCLFIALLLSLCAGLRYGETFSLHWADCARGKLFIRHNLVRGKITDSPKTRNSVRMVPLPASIWAELMAFKKEQEQFYTGPGLVFGSIFGTPVSRARVRNWWHALLKASGAPPGYRWHSNRATMATQLMAAGVPIKVVAQRLGHKNITTTLSRYAAILETMDNQATDVLTTVFKIPANS